MLESTPAALSAVSFISPCFGVGVFPSLICFSFSLAACLSVLVLILFVINVSVTNLAEVVVFTFVSEVELGKKSVEMKVGYYLVIPYTVLSLVAIGLIYFYEHAAYTHKQEQEKPTEDAPMETMMY